MNTKQRLAGETGSITSYTRLCDHALVTGTVPTYLFSADLCERLEETGHLQEAKIVRCEAGDFRKYSLTEKGRDAYVNQKRG